MNKIKSFFSKKRNIGMVSLALLFAIGIYTAQFVGNIPLHDGDVLVDSAVVADDKNADVKSSSKNSKTAEKKDTSKSDSKETVVNSDKSVTDYESNDLKELRANINLDRSSIIDTLNKTIESSKNQSEVKDAQAQRDKMLGYMEKETEIESLIKTKSLPESMVIITDKSVNVTVGKKKLDEATVSKICDIVMRQTERPASQVIVQPSKA